MAAFWHFLYLLNLGYGSANAVDPSGHVVYGGNAAQAFLVALYDHLQFVWTQFPGWCGAAWSC